MWERAGPGLQLQFLWQGFVGKMGVGGGAWEGNLKAALSDWLVHEEERQRDQYQPDEHLVVPEAGAGDVSRVRLGLLGSRTWALHDLSMRPECLLWVCSSTGGL